MASERIIIEEYRVTYSSNTFWPRIALLKAGKYFGQLEFLPNGKELPPDTKVFSGTGPKKNWTACITLHFHLDDFKNVIDLLRNEKPMYLVYAGSGPGNENCIDSFTEPVGEGETS